jgi:hypothetical protein
LLALGVERGLSARGLVGERVEWLAIVGRRSTRLREEIGDRIVCSDQSTAHPEGRVTQRSGA